jgi:hypothetical protein
MNLLDAAFALFRVPELTSAGVAFLASFLFCIVVVLTKRWHGALSMDTTVVLHSKVSLCSYTAHRRHSYRISLGHTAMYRLA